MVAISESPALHSAAQHYPWRPLVADPHSHSLPAAGSRSSSPGKLLSSGYGLATSAQRVPQIPTSEKRSKIPRSQGCSRETSPSRIGLGKEWVPGVWGGSAL
ncbi:hypothetical protein GDO81_019971 [Engystomops pustulosus]|uniref:Uncharacterized protein n=1 Tax=Engystomops pustulosus TaxID=76066 RepID=A0AAV6ZN94_ENGPU|nr:hypothetical protein GDO81_019971 [Engystomops pustulosus]